MAHISVDLPSISSAQKKKLIDSMREILSEIAGIEKSEISVSLHELPKENMNSSEYSEQSVKEKDHKDKSKELKKKSIFKEIFP